MKKLLSLAALAASSALTFAQGTISDGDASLALTGVSGATVRTGTTGGTNNLKTLPGTSDPDHLFQNWWWFRTPANPREFAFSNLSSQVYTGSRAFLVYDEVFENFQAFCCLKITDAGTNAAQFTWIVDIVNRDNVPLPISLFSYIDYDLAGTAASDEATAIQGPPNMLIGIRDTVTNTTGRYASPAIDAFQVSAFQVVRTLFTNGVVDNLNNSGLPFAAGDFTGAFQYNRVIPPLGRSRYYAFGAINAEIENLQPEFVGPTGFNILSGTPFGGNNASLQASDDDKVFILQDESDPNGILVFEGTAPCFFAEGGSVTFETGASRDDISFFYERFSRNAGNFVPLGASVSTLSDNTVSFNLGAFASDAINLPDRAIAARLRAVPQTDLEASDGWLEAVDMVRWRFDSF